MVEAAGRRIAFDHEPSVRWYYPASQWLVPRHRRKLHFSGLPPQQAAVAGHITVVTDPTVILVKNSKAGCTTLAQLMYRVRTGRFFEGFIHAEDKVLRQGLYWAGENVERVLARDGFVFTFVRHPEARLLSSYRDLVVEATNPSAGMHASALRSFGHDPGRGDGYNLDRFLDYVAASIEADPLRTDRHWRTQRVNVNFGEFRYDLIGRVETMQIDLDAVLDAMRVPGAERAEIVGQRFNTTAAAKAELSPEQRRRIAEIYAGDFEAFGY